MIKLTYFPKVKSKDDSALASEGELKEFNTFEQAVEFISKNAISPSVFKDNKRGKSNFLSTNLLMVDIDENLSILGAKKVLDKEELKYAIYTTTSHQMEKHGIISDRFRVILQPNNEITSAELFKLEAKKIAKILPQADLKCLETARYYLGHEGSHLEFKQGKEWKLDRIYGYESLIKKLNVTSEIKGEFKEFFTKAQTGIPGDWNNLLNKTAYIGARCEVALTELIRCVEEVAPNPLDDKDLQTAQSGYNAGKKAGPYKVKEKENQVNIIEKYIDSLDISMTPKGLYVKGDKFDLGELSNYIFVELMRKGFKISSNLVGSVVQDWYRLAKEDNSFNENYFKHLKHDPKSKGAELGKVVNAISSGNHELNKVAIAHWLWQVKRKIFNLPVEYHLMLVLYGKSGSGKTVFINKLIDTLRPFVLPSDVSMVNDNREYHNFSENFVVFFDEMAHAARADVNKLKNIITCETVSFRLLGKNSNVEHKNNASFIGASNTELVDLIKDPTSARRYFQLNTLDKLDWDLINDIDYAKLFMEIDEKAKPPMFPFMAELTQFQDQCIRAKDSIEEWIELEGIEFCEDKDEEGKEVSPNDLYEMYAEDQLAQGKRLFHRKWYFFRKLKDFGPQFREMDKRFYKLKPNKEKARKPFLKIAGQIKSEEVQ